jgi:uncharacterized membrane protein YedE/YeeE
MMRLVSGLCAGVLFGLGLAVSQMVNPAKVLGFLDVAGDWDPSLAFVMGAAIPVSALGIWLGRRQAAPWFAPTFSGPTRVRLDPRLLGGAAMFGVGWGRVGLCPGPALASVLGGSWDVALFVAAMLGGMAAFDSAALAPD